ncbi:hypothetical protein A5638_16445 [Mycolicibacterium fortuitum]|uniref:DUF2652 domain-containing protein n=1 Tax=Mycolicibacterium fortuitum TaxID=1766 RepID=UPI0007ED12B7|nr:DUF2652 domain-containing protein [Mycolicibacterium fortuitum]OBJ96484.1 hypothetical protein A5638_16445 [Mycolicibacterium fortuitum]
MQNEYRTREGYLLLADISGYTNFLTQTELEHAQAIVSELTVLVRDRFVPPMRFVKVEGDAVFCYAERRVFGDGERLLQLLEVCYYEFSNRLLNMARNTTCPCAACAAIASLDLKFICHYGTFVIDTNAGGVDLAGADVILVHRLLKNTVSQTTGVEAYALLTDACLEQLPRDLNLLRHEEHYESFGITAGGVHDLKPVLKAMRDSQKHYIGPDDADFVFSVEVPLPPVAAWNYWLDPIERQRWLCRHRSKHPDRATRNAQGRIGPGAAMHCNHGPATWRWEFIDWRPFSSVTHKVTASRVGPFVGLRNQLATFDFVPTPHGGTQVIQRIRLTNRRRLALLAYRIQHPVVAAYWRQSHRNLLRIIAQDKTDQLEPGTPVTD